MRSSARARPSALSIDATFDAAPPDLPKIPGVTAVFTRRRSARAGTRLLGGAKVLASYFPVIFSGQSPW